MKLLAYGSLKRGFLNEPLLADQKFLGKCVIADPDYKLYEIHGNFVFPALVAAKEAGTGYQVYGELYDVSEKCLTVLDRLEGVSVGLYERTFVKVVLPDGRVEEGVIAYRFLRDLGAAEHVGPVWPMSDLPRYKFLGHKFEQEEKEVEFNGVALYNKHLDTWATEAADSEAELRHQCMPKRIKFGVQGATEPWNSKWFEPRPHKFTRFVTYYRIRTGDTVSPDFSDRADLNTWTAEHLKFFGGATGTAYEWAEVLAKAVPKIDED